MRRVKKAIILSAMTLALAGLVATIFVFDNKLKTDAAIERIDAALYDIWVSIPIGFGPTSMRLSDLLIQPEEYIVPSITVDLDFNKILENIYDNDFQTIGIDRVDYLLEEIEILLGHLFDKTDDLKIRQTNIAAWERFILPDILSSNAMRINVSRFLANEKKRFFLETDFGNLELHSIFFSDRKEEDGETYFSVGYSSDEDGTPMIHVVLLDCDGNEISLLEHPGKSILLMLPRTLEFMQDEGNLFYDAVQYAGSNDRILPRSFMDDSYLYIYLNRLGHYKLVKTAGGTSVEEFLNDRGIHLEVVRGANRESGVTRASFFAALMRIHCVDSFLFTHDNTKPYPDVSDEELSRILSIGKILGICPGIPSSDRDSATFFYPNEKLTRGEMFVILSRYIQALEINASLLMPFDPRAEGLPDGITWWYNEDFTFLENIGFVPYRRVDSINFVLGDEPALLEECQEVLYKLLTAKNH
jgi:hypothetical protein